MSLCVDAMDQLVCLAVKFCFVFTAKCVHVCQTKTGAFAVIGCDVQTTCNVSRTKGKQLYVIKKKLKKMIDKIAFQ